MRQAYRAPAPVGTTAAKCRGFAAKSRSVACAVGGLRQLVVPWRPRGDAFGVRPLIVICLVAGSARADVSVGGSVGAGAQGGSTYSAFELRFDGAWEHGHVGLGLRGVWDDAVFRRSEWSDAADAVAVIRDASIHGKLGDTTLAIAAGALAPAHVGSLVDGYRVSLDDRWRTGVRAALRSMPLDATVEIDDVVDPALIAGGVRWQLTPPWGLHVGLALDPGGGRPQGSGTSTAIEVGGFRRFASKDARADLGVSIVAELTDGASGVAFANGMLDRGNLRFTARGDLRAGTGSVGGMFGPLWRVERLRMIEHRGVGAGAGASVGVAAPAGWIEVGARARPDLGGLVVATAGAPMGRWVQAALWAGVGRDDAAGAGEVRVAWSACLFSALRVARLYRFDGQLDAMQPTPVWAVTAWFGAATL